MTITPWRHSALIIAGILAGGLVHASTGMRYQFERALLPALTSAPLAAVMLDAPIYAGCQPDLCDLRLMENGAREQPYYVEQVMAMQPQVEQVAQPADIVTMRELPGNALEIVFQLGGENPGVSGLHVSTPLRDFERAVAVYVGATTQAWQLVVTDALLFDYARYMDVAQHDVRLPQHAAGRFVKLVISAVTDETRSALARVTHEWHAGNATNVRETVDLTRRAFRIDHVTMWQDVTREAVREAVMCGYPITDLTVTQDVRNGMTTLEFSAARAAHCGKHCHARPEFPPPCPAVCASHRAVAPGCRMDAGRRNHAEFPATRPVFADRPRALIPGNARRTLSPADQQ